MRLTIYYLVELFPPLQVDLAIWDLLGHIRNEPVSAIFSLSPLFSTFASACAAASPTLPAGARGHVTPSDAHLMHSNVAPV